MRWLFILILSLNALPAKSQESFEDFPISPLTGQLTSRFFTTYKAPPKDPGIRLITFCTTRQLADGRPDTSRHYQQLLAPNGAELGSIWVYIPDQRYLSVEAPNPSSLIRAYYRSIAGGGADMPFITIIGYTDYGFKKGRLSYQTQGTVADSRSFRGSPLPKEPQLVPGSFRIDYSYNKQRQLETTTATYRSDTGNRTLYDVRNYYRYDKQGRRLLSFHLKIADPNTAPPYDTLAALPDNFGTIITRHFARWSYDLSIPGIVEPDTSGEDEEPTNRQDTLDEIAVRSYMKQATDIAVYQYDSKGRPSGRLQFHGDELVVKDTFYYDAAGRCTGWHSIDLGGTGVNAITLMNNKEWQSVGRSTSTTDWTFEYDTRNRVIKAILKTYGKPLEYNITREESAKLSLEKVYEFSYLDNGLLGYITLTTTDLTHIYSPTTTSQDFILHYDKYETP